MVTRRRFNQSVGAALGGSALVGTVSADKSATDSDDSSTLTIDGIASDDGVVMLEGVSITTDSDGAPSVDVDSCDVLGMDESMADDIGLVGAFGDLIGGLIGAGSDFIRGIAGEIGDIVDGFGDFFEELDLGVGGIVNLVRCGVTIFQQLVVPLLAVI